MTSEQYFLETKVVAILRGIPSHQLPRLLEALYAGGVRLAEITMNSPNAIQDIGAMRRQFEGKMAIGAGTVLNKPSLDKALEAGAQFIVTPNIDPRVVEHCCNRDILIMPGALTPTEVVQAISCGSKYVKLFPAGSMGSGYLRELAGPLNQVRFVAVGGVGSHNAAAFLENGAVGVGVGGSLYTGIDFASGNFSEASKRAGALVDICKQATPGNH